MKLICNNTDIEFIKNSTANSEVTIYTDGACSGNPGCGGWGAVILSKDQEFLLSGGEKNTTNNRMEIIAAIKGLEAIATSAKINIYTDSKYLQDGITLWIKQWKLNGWLNYAKKPVKNQDLWQQLDKIVICHSNLNWNWVRGHAGNSINEKADTLAKQATIALQINNFKVL